MSFIRPEIIRPPHEYDSYFLPLTNGCSNSFCSFCNYYYGRRLKIRDVVEIKKEIDALVSYLNEGRRLTDTPDIVYALADQWDGRKIFLQDGDALVYPYPQLKGILEYLNLKFPLLEKVTCFGTAQDVLLRNVDELRQLKSLKLSSIYLGVESGDDEILRLINKGVDSRQMIKAGRRIKEAGITCPVTIILGLGGNKKSREHAMATAKIISEIDPDSVDALTLTPVAGTPIYDQVQRGDFSLISPMQSLDELKIIIENCQLSNCMVRSIHASNYLSVQGNLPHDRSSLLTKLNRIFIEWRFVLAPTGMAERSLIKVPLIKSASHRRSCRNGIAL